MWRERYDVFRDIYILCSRYCWQKYTDVYSVYDSVTLVSLTIAFSNVQNSQKTLHFCRADLREVSSQKKRIKIHKNNVESLPNPFHTFIQVRSAENRQKPLIQASSLVQSSNYNIYLTQTLKNQMDQNPKCFCMRAIRYLRHSALTTSKPL